MSAGQAKALRSLVEPIVSSFDCDLETITIRQAGRRRMVRVVVDHAGGLSMDLVADVSRAISRALDDVDLLGQSPYVLEVTSPGVDRPLTVPRHWARAVGRLVVVTPRGGESLRGRVLEADEQGATLDVDGRQVRVVYADVARAIVQVEFSRIDDVELEDAEDPADGPEDAAHGPEDAAHGPEGEEA